MTHPARRWDIFCTVVDNYGDIGVTWRLARQLVTEYAQPVCLWVDDLHSFRSLCPELDLTQNQQVCRGVQIRHWQDRLPTDWIVGDRVIEAFACELPPTIRAQMIAASPPPLWINLEYLSAESWIDDCHALPSLQSNGLPKYFFFPGFSPRSGGLICEQNLEESRQAWQANPMNRAELFHRLGIPPQPADCWYVSVFTYESQALPGLLDSWQESATPVCCLIPQGRTLNSLCPWLGVEKASPGDSWQRGQLTLVVVPFTDQEGYDQLLWSCDLNLVRGEDSFLRAQWAGRPFVWHIYPQEDLVHLDKLQAFLQRYGANLPETCRDAVNALFLSYNEDRSVETKQAWQALQADLPEWRHHANLWPKLALAGGDLASRLVQFSEKRLE